MTTNCTSPEACCRADRCLSNCNPSTKPMIVRDGAGAYFKVTEAGSNLSHCWSGMPMKRVKNGFLPKSGAKLRLVRKIGTVVVEG